MTVTGNITAVTLFGRDFAAFVADAVLLEGDQTVTGQSKYFLLITNLMVLMDRVYIFKSVCMFKGKMRELVTVTKSYKGDIDAPADVETFIKLHKCPLQRSPH